jgi:glycosyltransferase involved in cell wall biosynthesis
MSAPELSIVIPAHNEERLIGEQLAALADQIWDGGEWEVLVVDNRSTDATVAVVLAYVDRLPGLRIVTANERASLSYARNAGILAAAADHIAICDADDVVAPGWVAAMGTALRGHRFVTGRLDVDRLNPVWLADSRGRAGDCGPTLFAGLFPGASGGNLGLHRDVWAQLGGFREGVQGAEDLMFSMDAWLHEINLYFEAKAILHYRYRADPRSLWRQGRSYGRARTAVYKALRHEGFSPPHFGGWRSWLWLISNLPSLCRRENRLRWIWVAGNRVGHVEGSLRHRTIAL